MFCSKIGLYFLYIMLFFRNNIVSSFSYMGRNRNTLAGGKWGEAMMTTIMNAHSQQQRHIGSSKKSKQRNSEKNAFPISRPSSTSPSPYSARNKGQKYFIKNNGNGNDKNEPLYKPRTANQALYLKYLIDDRVKIVLGVGPAGCGKTLFACHRAIEELMEGGVQKIVITRPMVSVEDESVGFLPGDMTQKMAPWTRPIFDIFHEYFDPLDVQDMIRRGVVEISPLAYMRGRTFKDAFIIADEMQNSTPNQMLMLTTRLGENAKMAITGDLKQSDKGLENNGLADFMRKLYGYRRVKLAQDSGGEKGAMGGFLGVKLVQLCSTDICRSDIVSRILDMYQVVSEAPVSVLDYDSGVQDWEESDEEGGQGGSGDYADRVEKRGGTSPDMREYPYSVARAYSFQNGKQWKHGKQGNKSNTYQPKPKRYQVSVLDEPEYQDDFRKNLKKVIENVIQEQNTPELKEVDVIDVEPFVGDGSAAVDAMDEPDKNETVVIKIANSEEERQDNAQSGSSDCAMITKSEEERSQLFRFFAHFKQNK